MTTGLAGFALDLLMPLRSAATDPAAFRLLLSELGFSALDDVLTFDIVPGFTDVPGLVDQVEQLAETASSGADDAAADTVVQALSIATSVLQVVDDVRTWTPPAVPDIDVSGVGLDIATYLPGLLLSRWMQGRMPAVRNALLLAGVIAEDRTLDRDGLARPRTRIDWDQLATLLSGDFAGAMDAYGWGGSGDWEHRAFVERLRRVVLGLGVLGRSDRIASTFVGGAPAPFSDVDAVPETLRQLSIPVVTERGANGFAELGFAFVPLPSTRDGDIDALVITNLTYGSVFGAIDIGGGWMVTVGGAADATGAAQLLLQPGQTPSLLSATPDASVSLGITSPARDWVVLGSTDGTRLVVGGVGANITLDADPLEFTATASTQPGSGGVEFVLDPGEGDGFISSLFGDTVVSAGFDLAASISTISGVTIDGAAGFSIALPIGIKIGPIEFYDLEIGAVVGGDSGALVRIDVGASMGAALGPLAVSVNGIGLTASLTLDQNATPLIRVGELGIDLGFKAPTGLGLGLDLGVVKGGGYLNIDAPAGEYEGVLALEVLGIGIAAFGLIETKNPNVDGWSLMMALYIELPAIQLGFGFTLSGVGGLAGINRTIDAEALGEAVRSGQLNTILFPDDPIADAPLIISTLASIFPAANDRYVFGPVIKVGWGTPSLIEASIGVVIELPDPIRIAILGSISCVLPTPELELIALRLDVAGIIDFGAGTIAVDASLHNSHVIGFALAGDMALRASLRGQPDFLLSLGGFHPAYDPPAGFPRLARLSLGLSAGSLFSISFECYFALTSNTVQFGAAFSVAAKVAGFGIEGGTEFDALIQFDPFLVKTHIGLHIAITAGGVDLMGVWLSGDLEGPNPWHITGTATFKVLGVKKEINVNQRIGGSSNELPVATPNLRQMLVDALGQDEALVIIRSTADGVVVAQSDSITLASPSAVIGIAQNVVPLKTPITRYGSATDLDHHEFDVAVVGGGMSESGQMAGWFSPAQFLELGPKEKLAAPSFDSMPSGIQFGGGISSGSARPATLDHEISYIDPEFDAWVATLPDPPAEEPRYVEDGHRMRAMTSSPVSMSSLSDVDTGGTFSIVPVTYAVVDTTTGAALDSGMHFAAAFGSTGVSTIVVPDFEVHP